MTDEEDLTTLERQMRSYLDYCDNSQTDPLLITKNTLPQYGLFQEIINYGSRRKVLRDHINECLDQELDMMGPSQNILKSVIKSPSQKSRKLIFEWVPCEDTQSLVESGSFDVSSYDSQLVKRDGPSWTDLDQFLDAIRLRGFLPTKKHFPMANWFRIMIAIWCILWTCLFAFFQHKDTTQLVFLILSLTSSLVLIFPIPTLMYRASNQAYQTRRKIFIGRLAYQWNKEKKDTNSQIKVGRNESWIELHYSITSGKMSFARYIQEFRKKMKRDTQLRIGPRLALAGLSPLFGNPGRLNPGVRDSYEEAIRIWLAYQQLKRAKIAKKY